WLANAPKWQQRLFLAAHFGAELTSPATVPGHGTVFASPTLSLNKRATVAKSGEDFLRQLSALLAGFGVATHAICCEDARGRPSDGLPRRTEFSNIRLLLQVGSSRGRRRLCLGARGAGRAEPLSRTRLRFDGRSPRS